MNTQKTKENMMMNIKTSSIWLFFIMSGFVYSQPDGGGFESCSDLDAEMCEIAPFCELTDEGCVESDGGWGDDGGWDFTSCLELSADECAEYDYCALNDAGECTLLKI